MEQISGVLAYLSTAQERMLFYNPPPHDLDLSERGGMRLPIRVSYLQPAPWQKKDASQGVPPAFPCMICLCINVVAGNFRKIRGNMCCDFAGWRWLNGFLSSFLKVLNLALSKGYEISMRNDHLYLDPDLLFRSNPGKNLCRKGEEFLQGL